MNTASYLHQYGYMVHVGNCFWLWPGSQACLPPRSSWVSFRDTFSLESQVSSAERLHDLGYRRSNDQYPITDQGQMEEGLHIPRGSAAADCTGKKGITMEKTQKCGGIAKKKKSASS